MGKPVEVPAADRTATRRLCAEIVASVENDAKMPLPLTSYNESHFSTNQMCDLSAVEGFAAQMAMEVVALQGERDEARGLLELAMSKWVSLSGNRTWGAQDAEDRQRCAKALGPDAMARVTAEHPHNGPLRKA